MLRCDGVKSGARVAKESEMQREEAGVVVEIRRKVEEDETGERKQERAAAKEESKAEQE